METFATQKFIQALKTQNFQKLKTANNNGFLSEVWLGIFNELQLMGS
jgi:hypothetical protein